MDNEKYIICLPSPKWLEELSIGDWTDGITGANIVGPFCLWPKPKLKTFTITNISESEITIVAHNKENVK